MIPIHYKWINRQTMHDSNRSLHVSMFRWIVILCHFHFLKKWSKNENWSANEMLIHFRSWHVVLHSLERTQNNSFEIRIAHINNMHVYYNDLLLTMISGINCVLPDPLNGLRSYASDTNGRVRMANPGSSTVRWSHVFYCACATFQLNKHGS